MPDNRLHDTDFYTWTQQQAEALRALASGRKSNEVDWENVIEEIECLGSEQEYALESHLINILVHVLKLNFSPAVDPRQHWKEEVATQRVQLERRLRKNPGLKSKLDALFNEAYADARQEAAIGLEEDGLSLADLPETCPYSLEQTRDMNWFPAGRAGNERVKD